MKKLFVLYFMVLIVGAFLEEGKLAIPQKEIKANGIDKQGQGLDMVLSIGRRRAPKSITIQPKA